MTRTEFAKLFPGQYAWLLRNDVDLLDKTLPRGNVLSWTYVACKEDAMKYKTRSEWAIENQSAYNAARKNGWLEDCSKHMAILKKRISAEDIRVEYKKYKTLKEFREYSAKYYGAAIRFGMISEIKSYLITATYWTLELVRVEAIKYNTRSSFAKGSAGAYNWCLINNCLDEVCSHMLKINNSKRLQSIANKSLNKLISIIPLCVRYVRNFINMSTKCVFYCEKYGEFEAVPRNLLQKNGAWTKGLSGHPKMIHERQKKFKTQARRVINGNGEIFESARYASVKMGLNKGAVSDAILKRKQLKGVFWAYCDENGKIIDSKKKK